MFERLLIVSDMDGTLLNHHDYQFDAVTPVLAQLEQMQLPVILNTSKTFAELKSWVQKLNIRHPFIVENGSAIFIPNGYFPNAAFAGEIVDKQSFEGYQVVLLGESIVTLSAFLIHHKPQAIDFSSCSAEQAMQLTGLSPQQVAEAQDRQFSIPLSFDDKEAQNRFAEFALQSGLGVLEGGRFLHILGKTDKGLATRRLRRLFESVHQQSYGVIALGDSPNDEAMLAEADVAVVVSSPSSERVQPTVDHLIRTRQQAPQGWNEGIQEALKLIQQETTTG